MMLQQLDFALVLCIIIHDYNVGYVGVRMQNFGSFWGRGLKSFDNLDSFEWG